MTLRHINGHSAWCDTHQKVAHSTRKRAKYAARLLHDSGMQEYRCDALDGYWHIGHVARLVKRGVRTRGEMAAKRRKQRGGEV